MKLPELKTVRLLRGMTQPDLAEASGVSLRTIVNQEHGKEARPSTARKLSEALDVSVAVLAGVEPFPTTHRSALPVLVPLLIPEMFEAAREDRQRALEAATPGEIRRFIREVDEHRASTEAALVEQKAEALAAGKELRGGHQGMLAQHASYLYELGRLHEQAVSYLPSHAGVGAA